MNRFFAVGLISSLLLAGCGPGPGAVGTKKGEIRGTILRAPGQPLNEAKVLLLSGNPEKEMASLRTGANGTFAFPNLAAGTYRVRFTLTASDEDKALIEYNFGEARTTEFFAQLTSQSVSFDGQAAKLVEVSPLTVGWKPGLEPHDKSISTDRFLGFSWQPAPNARNYVFELLKLDGSEFFRSPEQAGTDFELTSFKGNAGSANGQPIQKGGQYYYRVRVGLHPGTSPGADYGYSTVTRLKVE
ncbi:MAG TPA: carboxypeptidase-like regulatory domain-containing protein [Candidatus Obscuribacterales bacterium]